MDGYTFEEFSSSYNFYNNHSNSETSSSSSSSSIPSASSFFRSTVVRSIFGSHNNNNTDTKNARNKWRKIKSQAPSFRQNCCSTPQSQLESTENKYISILIDFAYLSNPDQFEGGAAGGAGTSKNDIEKDSAATIATAASSSNRSTTAAEQEHLEREFATKYQPTLRKFYTLFEDIYHFYTDIESFVRELNDGHFVEYTLRSLLLESVEARQLLCEVFYLYGSLLSLLDVYIPVSIYFLFGLEKRKRGKCF